MRADAAKFSATLAVVTSFDRVADLENYRSLPEDWVLALSDVVNSTAAIAKGRYKEVNLAGASSISALVNVCDEVLYAFGGDGAVAALPGSCETVARETLAKLRTWAAEGLELELRVALIPVSEVRAAGVDVLVSLYQASESVAYAMFAGGGSAWAETQMKAGRFLIDAAPPGSTPDLKGLSCRWSPIPAERGNIVSLVVYPTRESNRSEFQTLVSEVVTLVSQEEREAHPLPERGPSVSLTFKGIWYESSAHSNRFVSCLRIAALTSLAVLFDRLNLRIGPLRADEYRAEIARNSDFRKFDDGLKMTVDLPDFRIAMLQDLLEDAARAGLCTFGLERQDAALMTCFAPSLEARDHVHFIDGAGGGYAAAASQAKFQMTHGRNSPSGSG
jgi:hypothetical protein